MDSATQQFKGDIWQVLAHLLANNLIWMGLAFAAIGIALLLLSPVRGFGRTLTLSGGTLLIIAVLLHSVAWTPLL